MLPHFRVKTCASLLFHLHYFYDFPFQGGSEEELAGGSNEIRIKGKKYKKVRPVSRGKRTKKNKSFHYSEESDEENKHDHGERPSEDIESVWQCSSEEREMDESTEALRENVNGEEDSHSEGHQDNSDVGVDPREMEKSHIEPSSPDGGASIAEISDDTPLVNNSAFVELYVF